jgi:Flp pilus assembly protein TadD
MTIAPHDLAVFYPHEATFGRSIPTAHVVGAAAVLIAISAAAVVLFRRAPYLLVGWLWYLGTLVPVIGIVQIGRQSMADRYTYVPSIGLAIAIAWGVADLVGRLRVPAVMTGGAVAAVLLACLIGTRLQLRHWRDRGTLWTRAAAVVPDNYAAHYSLGVIASANGNLPAARQHYARAVEVNPGYRPAQNNLGAVLEQLGDRAGAERHYRAAIKAEPTYADAHFNLGRLLVAQGRADEGIERLAEAARLSHDPFEPYVVLAVAQRLAGRPDDAAASLRAALEVRKNDAAGSAAVLEALAGAYAAGGRVDDAIAAGDAAVARARETGDATLADAVARRVAGYRSGRPPGTMDVPGAGTRSAMPPTTALTRPTPAAR